MSVRQRSSASLAELLIQSLENERVLDTQVARGYYPDAQLRRLPEFKQLRLVALKTRLGPFIYPLLGLAAIGIPAAAVLSWIAALCYSALKSHDMRPQTDPVYPAFLEKHGPLIRSALAQDPSDPRPDVTALRRRDILQAVPARSVLRGAGAHLLILWRILRQHKGQRLSLVLHSHKLFDLILVALFAGSHPQTPLVTSSIYQHWAYIIGHAAPRSWMVQHGYMSPSIKFPYPFADVERLYAFSEQQLNCYRRYYNCASFHLIQSEMTLSKAPDGRSYVLLASSAPHIATEISFAEAFKKEFATPLAIKLHPRHTYDNRVQELVKLADYTVPPDQNLACLTCVSHSSFYALHYQGAGVPTLELQDFDSVELALKSLKDVGIV